MNHEDMIKLAREAGWEYADDDRGFEPLWRFATLVAAAEREACAQVCEGHWRHSGTSQECADAIQAKGEK